MRHRRKGRHLGRCPSHQRALLRNLASALFLTEEALPPLLGINPPAVRGRITTTLAKAKEVRPLVEKCITLAVKVLEYAEAAQPLATTAARNSEEWRAWRHGQGWLEWTKAIAPAVATRRRIVRLLGNKQAATVLIEKIAPRFRHRAGGYTRIIRLAKPRVGDAGTRAILELVGVRDRRAPRAPRPKLEMAPS